ncbi:AAA family ATPase [Planktotalea sp.]|uniref:ExeA family protein n=1 Tax=Planktotalea sp. TaxID=2029877 RepID=UPI003299CF69
MVTELYTQFYGFSERPFTLLPDPDFIFWSKAHRRAFSVLDYGIQTHAPLTVVTGEVGAGKTTLLQHLLKDLDESKTVGLISNAQGNRGDLLRWILHVYGIEPDSSGDYVALFRQFQNFVIDEYSMARNVLLIIDEAQNLSIEVLEELRMLTNINSNKDELLQLILVGQPELRSKIQRPELRQFAQRVSAFYHLMPMDADTTTDYIRHRLQHVGGSGDEIAPDAIAKIFEETGGIPRMVNKLSDITLVYGASDGLKVVGGDTVEEILEDGLFITSQKFADPLRLTDRVDTHKKVH